MTSIASVVLAAKYGGVRFSKSKSTDCCIARPAGINVKSFIMGAGCNREDAFNNMMECIYNRMIIEVDNIEYDRLL